VQIVQSKLIKKYGVNLIFQNLVKELKELNEVGFIVKNDVFQGVLKVKLFQLVSDNLGLHSLLGFSESFVSNFFLQVLQNA
jgi:hypothetical protein